MVVQPVSSKSTGGVKTSGFIVCGQTKAGRKASGEHFGRCLALNEPYLAINARRKYADIVLDIVELAEGTQRALHDAVLPYFSPGLSFSIGSGYCFVCNIPVADGMKLVKLWAGILRTVKRQE